LKLFSKNFIGIDIGTSSIKVVELKGGKSKTLSNYGILSSDYFIREAYQDREPGTLAIDESVVSEVLSSILKEAKIKSKDAFFAIPDYATFFTTFNLPTMSESEIPQAVKYEAPRRIPLPLSEVTLDWQIIKGGPSKGGRAPVRILLVAVPNELIAQYQKIANSVGLKIVALEAEVFALVRALIKYQDKSNVVCLVDIGDRSTTITIVAQGILKASYSFDVSGEDFTNVISEQFKIEKKKAETIKKIYGFTDQEPSIKKIIMPVGEAILGKIKSIFDEVYLEDKERVDKVILAGGGSGLIGFADYLSTELDLPVELANPFLDIAYPPTLEDTLKKLGFGFTIAVGMALRGFSK